MSLPEGGAAQERGGSRLARTRKPRSMKCDLCGELLQYREQIVALREEGGQVIAGYTIEGDAGAVAETFEPVGKYHEGLLSGVAREPA
jgi:hypothetical protein